MLGLLWRKGGQEIEGRLWFGRKRWIAVPFPSVAGNGCGRVYQDVTRGCPKNQAARNLLSTGVPSRLDLFSRSPGDHRALFNFPDRTGADPGALRPLSLPSLLELFIN